MYQSNGGRTYDTDEAHGETPYCPMTRRVCMGRYCAAAEAQEARLAARLRGHGTEWHCTEYGGRVIDYDETEAA